MSIPIIIYTSVRSRGTATLQACIYERKIWEPFHSSKLFQNNLIPLPKTSIDNSDYHRQIDINYYKYANRLTPAKLHTIFNELNKPSTVVKLISNELSVFLPGRKWYKNAIESGSHRSFVLVRELKELFYSVIFANKFGYFKKYQSTYSKFTIEKTEYMNFFRMLDNFITYMPRYGKIISFDSLPEEYFDKNRITLENQNTMENLRFIENLDECESNVEQLIKYIKTWWEDSLSHLD